MLKNDDESESKALGGGSDLTAMGRGGWHGTLTYTSKPPTFNDVTRYR